ncbi:MAG: hypothetical protein AAF846_15240 [Chloroflexota bacterium]
MSAHVYWFFGRGDWLAPQRLDSTISSALIFAHLFAITVIIARDVVEKPLSMRLIIGMVGGTFFGTLTWFAHVFLFLYQSAPNMLTLILGGFALIVGFVVAGLPIKFSTIIGMFISAIAIYGTIFITYNNYLVDSSAQALLYFQLDNPNDIYLIGLPFTLTLAIIPNLPLLVSSSPIAET